MRPDLYNILLFLAAGGYNWQESFQHLPIPWSRPDSKPQEPTEPSAEESGRPLKKVYSRQSSQRVSSHSTFSEIYSLFAATDALSYDQTPYKYRTSPRSDGFPGYEGVCHEDCRLKICSFTRLS
jgi:hypothetical protein